MPTLNASHVTLCALASGALLSGCSGASSPSSFAGTPVTQNSATHSSFASPDAKQSKKGLIYVADYTNSAVHIYPLRGKKEIGLITGVPVVEYLNVDRFHNLYVVEFSAGKVLVYPEGRHDPVLDA